MISGEDAVQAVVEPIGLVAVTEATKKLPKNVEAPVLRVRVFAPLMEVHPVGSVAEAVKT